MTGHWPPPESRSPHPRYDRPVLIITAGFVALIGPAAGLLFTLTATGDPFPLVFATFVVLPLALFFGLIFNAYSTTVRLRSIGLGMVFGAGIGVLTTGGTCLFVWNQVFVPVIISP